MLSEELLQTLVGMITQDIERLQSMVENQELLGVLTKELSGSSSEQDRYTAEEIDRTIHRLLMYSDILREQLSEAVAHRGQATLSTDLLSAAATAQVLVSQASILQGTVKNVAQTITSGAQSIAQVASSVVNNALSWIENTLMPHIQSILNQVWQVVVGLVMPKEWSISGGVGTSLLGLANAELEIIFGP